MSRITGLPHAGNNELHSRSAATLADSQTLGLEPLRLRSVAWSLCVALRNLHSDEKKAHGALETSSIHLGVHGEVYIQHDSKTEARAAAFASQIGGGRPGKPTATADISPAARASPKSLEDGTVCCSGVTLFGLDVTNAAASVHVRRALSATEDPVRRNVAHVSAVVATASLEGRGSPQQMFSPCQQDSPVTAEQTSTAANCLSGGSSSSSCNGSTNWCLAPEQLLGKEYGTPADIFAIGCILAELATGQPLFPGRTRPDQLRRMAHLLCAPALEQSSPPPSSPSSPSSPSCSSSALQAAGRGSSSPPDQDSPLLRQWLQRWMGHYSHQDRTEFPSAHSVRELADVIMACLRFDPPSRPSAEQLLRMPYFAAVHGNLASPPLPSPPLHAKVEADAGSAACLVVPEISIPAAATSAGVGPGSYPADYDALSGGVSASMTGLLASVTKLATTAPGAPPGGASALFSHSAASLPGLDPDVCSLEVPAPSRSSTAHGSAARATSDLSAAAATVAVCNATTDGGLRESGARVALASGDTFTMSWTGAPHPPPSAAPTVSGMLCRTLRYGTSDDGRTDDGNRGEGPGADRVGDGGDDVSSPSSTEIVVEHSGTAAAAATGTTGRSKAAAAATPSSRAFSHTRAVYATLPPKGAFKPSGDRVLLGMHGASERAGVSGNRGGDHTANNAARPPSTSASSSIAAASASAADAPASGDAFPVSEPLPKLLATSGGGGGGVYSDSGHSAPLSAMKPPSPSWQPTTLTESSGRRLRVSSPQLSGLGGGIGPLAASVRPQRPPPPATTRWPMEARLSMDASPCAATLGSERCVSDTRLHGRGQRPGTTSRPAGGSGWAAMDGAAAATSGGLARGPASASSGVRLGAALRERYSSPAADSAALAGVLYRCDGPDSRITSPERYDTIVGGWQAGGSSRQLSPVDRPRLIGNQRLSLGGGGSAGAGGGGSGGSGTNGGGVRFSAPGDAGCGSGSGSGPGRNPLPRLLTVLQRELIAQNISGYPPYTTNGGAGSAGGNCTARAWSSLRSDGGGAFGLRSEDSESGTFRILPVIPSVTRRSSDGYEGREITGYRDHGINIQATGDDDDLYDEMTTGHTSAPRLVEGGVVAAAAAKPQAMYAAAAVRSVVPYDATTRAKSDGLARRATERLRRYFGEAGRYEGSDADGGGNRGSGGGARNGTAPVMAATAAAAVGATSWRAESESSKITAPESAADSGSGGAGKGALLRSISRALFGGTARQRIAPEQAGR